MKKPEFYTLEPVYPSEPDGFFNASIGHCGLCGSITTTMGGSNNQICVPCADVIMRKRAVGAIKWEDGTS